MDKSDSDSTPDVTYSWYTSGTNRIGRLQSVSSSTATETFSTYDALGRVTAHTQEIVNNSNDYTLSYTYRLDDSIATMTYPSGREVDYTTDNAGRVRTVDDGAITFADLSGDTTDIDPLGRIANMALGNGLWEARDYRPAGTDTELKLGTSEGGSQRLELGYSYSGTANNGNLTNHTITHPGPATYSQSFTYDAVNRLSTASETDGYSRTFGYDQYSNRWVSSSSGLYYADSHEPTAQSNFSTSTNRLNVASSTYDNAGNQTFFTPYTLTFDAANRITAAESTSNGDMYYGYDGSGRRVGKSWTPQGGSEVLTYYIYDIAGRLAAEYTDGDPGTPELSWVFPDILGSVRAVTDDAGNISECYDYTPFGRMLTTEDNGRSSVGCYPGSPTSYTTDLRDKFTGQQRDEDRLDYFIARYYADGQGRFASADPLSGWPDDPQSWNRYAYGRNSPLTYVDPSGMSYEICNFTEGVDDCSVDFWGEHEDFDYGEWAVLKRLEGLHVPEPGRSGGICSGDSDCVEKCNSPSETCRGYVTYSPPTLTEQALFALFGSDSFISPAPQRDELFPSWVLGRERIARTQGGLDIGPFENVGGELLFEDSDGQFYPLITGTPPLASPGWGLFTWLKKGATLTAGARNARIALHPAHHTFRWLGRLSHIQINLWETGVSGSGRVIRIPLPWR